MERLLQEAIPTRPDRPPKPHHEPWTPEEQAQHWQELGEAIRDWHWEDDTSLSKRRREHRRRQAAQTGTPHPAHHQEQT